MQRATFDTKIESMRCARISREGAGRARRRHGAYGSLPAATSWPVVEVGPLPAVTSRYDNRSNESALTAASFYVRELAVRS